MGLDTGLAYFEWSAADDCDVTDPQEWWGFHPALGHTIEQATIQADFASMPLSEFRRGYCNQWLAIRMQPVGPLSVVMLGGRLRSDMAKPKYGGAHQKLRRAMLPTAVGAACVRCGLVIVPGQPVDLDHLDDGSGRYRGWAHRHCNRSAGATLGNVMRGAKRRRRRGD